MARFPASQETRFVPTLIATTPLGSIVRPGDPIICKAVWKLKLPGIIDLARLPASTWLTSDSPEAVMLALSSRCKKQIKVTLFQVTDSVSSKAGNIARLQQAQADLATARQLAVQFGLDTYAVDQKATWVQQAALARYAGNGPIAQVGGVSDTPPGGIPLNAKHKLGLEMIEKTRLEMKSGSYTVAAAHGRASVRPGLRCNQAGRGHSARPRRRRACPAATSRQAIVRRGPRRLSARRF